MTEGNIYKEVMTGTHRDRPSLSASCSFSSSGREVMQPAVAHSLVVPAVTSDELTEIFIHLNIRWSHPVPGLPLFAGKY